MIKEITILSLIVSLLLPPLINGDLPQRQILDTPKVYDESNNFSDDELIGQGLQVARNSTASNDNVRYPMLVQWYENRPEIIFASLIGTTITVKFIDGSYTVILDAFPQQNAQEPDNSPFVTRQDSIQNGAKAILLNPFEYLYGHHQCDRIATILQRHEYQVEYLENENVNISFLRYNLSADIVYMNTHAGYFDIDGDQQADAVVIATGEPWTNHTEQDYAFDYQRQLIVKGMVGDQGFVTFTPAFIAYYYPAASLPDSLVYMATCYASFDDSMAQSFLDAGAAAYMGWTRETLFWTNSRTSVNAIRLFTYGLTVHQVCTIIRYGGAYNRLFRSKLVYYGEGDYRIPL